MTMNNILTSSGLTLKDYLFGAVKLPKNVDPDKSSYSEYGIGFDSRSLFSVPNFDWGENVFVFGVENSSSAHVDNRKKNLCPR